ncbi:LysE family translocator [Prauserella cavernicola]|uniref:LysE family translocator n=1 Tax=Prauserella cavernicola TaxID=2800127 RepID=A0A934QV35_9PSEU|nr:LysE family translocator [Prauserella cavernicola]MBK1787050.1 LysE family translocator [Prauserella cavernicola]
MELSILVAFMVTALVISLVPGPDMMFIVANGVARGPRAGVVAALGMSTGLAVHTVAAAAGLGALLQAAPAVLDAVRVVGAVFLLYLAWTAWRSSRRPDVPGAEDVAPGRSLRRTYVLAVLTNLANPKVILFYLAFFPQFVVPAGGWPVWVQFLVLGAVFVLVGFAVDGSVGLATGALAVLLLRRPAVRRWLDRLSAAIFAGLAVRLVTEQPR